MQFVPVNRPSALKKRNETEIKNVVAAKPSKEATEAAAPFVFNFKPVGKAEAVLDAPPAEHKAEQAFQERSPEERRKYCRRIQNVQVLYELRAGADRRRKNQRKSDITTAVDEMA